MSRLRSPRVLQLLLVLATLGCSSSATHAEQPCPRVEFAVVHPKASADTRPVRYGARTLHVDRIPITSLEDISEAHTDKDPRAATVFLSFKTEATGRLSSVTTNHSGIQLAFVIDSEVVLSVTWQGDYGLDSTGVQVSLQNTRRANAIVDTINRCLAKE